MKLKPTLAGGALAIVAVAALAGCSSNTSPSSGASSTPSKSAADYSSLSGTITAGGSCAQADVQAAWVSAFTAQATNVKVNYDKSQGSGGGVTNWLSGSYDFEGTDAALSSEQYSAANARASAGDAT